MAAPPGKGSYLYSASYGSVPDNSYTASLTCTASLAAADTMMCAIAVTVARTSIPLLLRVRTNLADFNTPLDTVMPHICTSARTASASLATATTDTTSRLACATKSIA